MSAQENQGAEDSPRKRKTAGALLTISEVAAELDVPQHVLRFWESRFHQIKPVKRAGGRRYYRPEDIDLLHRIRHLLYDSGYTVKGVQKQLRVAGRAKGGGAHAVDEAPWSETQKSFLRSLRDDLEAVKKKLESGLDQ